MKHAQIALLTAMALGLTACGGGGGGGGGVGGDGNDMTKAAQPNYEVKEDLKQAVAETKILSDGTPDKIDDKDIGGKFDLNTYPMGLSEHTWKADGEKGTLKIYNLPYSSIVGGYGDNMPFIVVGGNFESPLHLPSPVEQVGSAKYQGKSLWYDGSVNNVSIAADFDKKAISGSISDAAGRELIAMQETDIKTNSSGQELKYYGKAVVAAAPTVKHIYQGTFAGPHAEETTGVIYAESDGKPTIVYSGFDNSRAK